MPTNVSTHISNGGRIVIPAQMRKAYGIKVGDEITIVSDEKGIHLLPRNWAIKEMQRLAKKYIPKDKRGRMVDEFIAERRAEALKELE